MERCQSAVKLLRANQNHVPKMKFCFTSSSVRAAQSADDASKTHPMASTAHNVEFRLNSTVGEVRPPVKQLPARTKELVKCLGMNSMLLFSKVRAKEVAAVLSQELAIASTTAAASTERSAKPAPAVASKQFQDAAVWAAVPHSSSHCQTDPLQCEQCVARKRRTFASKASQASPPKSTELATQTDEEDYREPIVELLSQLTAAQLVAVKDFATIVLEPRPQSSIEMYKMRERITDVYNLSQRDADAVRTAQQNRLDDPVALDRLRYRGSGDAYSEREFEEDRHSGSGGGNASHAQHLLREFDGPSGSNSRPHNQHFSLFNFRGPEQMEYEEARSREHELEMMRIYEEERRQRLMDEEDAREQRRRQAEEDAEAEELEIRRQQAIMDEKRRRQSEHHRDVRGSSTRGARGGFRNNNHRPYRGRGHRGRI